MTYVPETVRGKMMEARAMRAQAHRLLDEARALETAAMLQDRREADERAMSAFEDKVVRRAQR